MNKNLTSNPSETVLSNKERLDRSGAREEFEYIVIGTGAGGGPVAANLAKAGKKVLVLEAGGDGNNPRSIFEYEIAGSNPRLDPELGWAYWVNSRAKEDDRARQHFYVPGKGIYYPRGTSIGGSTTVNAMIALYPDNGDWNRIADLTGDRSWESGAMRRYFERVEAVRYAEPTNGNPERQGYEGWLPVEMVGTKRNLCKDPWLAKYVVSRVCHEEGGDQFEQTVLAGGDFAVDPNDWRFVERRETGMVEVPRSSEEGARRGTRELLLKTAREHPEHLTIRTDCLVTGLLFDAERKNVVIGVKYLEGAHLYGASLLADIFASRPGTNKAALATREVIVAGGAFNSPQLLMLSGIGPEDQLRRHGIPVRVNLPGVGRNLQDRLEMGVVCKLPFSPNIYQGLTFGAEGDPGFAEFLAKTPNGAYRTRLSRQMYIIKRSSPEREIPNLALIGYTGTFRGYYHPTRIPQQEHDAFTWFTLSGHTQNTGGTVTLKSASPRDTPEINFNNFEDGTDSAGVDLEALLSGVKMSRRLAASGLDGSAEGEISPGRDCNTDADLREFIKNETWGHHASCTNKMGLATDSMAVVDSRFRVHGTERLRVVDASIFPRIPGLFIVVPIYMAAEKASDVILADFK